LIDHAFAHAFAHALMNHDESVHDSSIVTGIQSAPNWYPTRANLKTMIQVIQKAALPMVWLRSN
jgi:hypothetical protein